MTVTEIVLAIISVVGTCSSILFAYLAFKRNDRGDRKQEGKNEGVLISDVGYIKSSIDRIEKSIDKLDANYSSLSERVVKVEATLDAHIKNKDIHKVITKGGNN
jgi:hypothetical protein